MFRHLSSVIEVMNVNSHSHMFFNHADCKISYSIDLLFDRNYSRLFSPPFFFLRSRKKKKGGVLPEEHMNKIPSLSEVAHIMNGRSDREKIRTLRKTLSNFFRHVKQSGYTIDGSIPSLDDFLEKDEFGPGAASNLIKTIWLIVNAEMFAEEELKRN